MLERETFELVVQVNGKVRDRVEVAAGTPEAELIERAKALPRVQSQLDGKEVRGRSSSRGSSSTSWSKGLSPVARPEKRRVARVTGRRVRNARDEMPTPPLIHRAVGGWRPGRVRPRPTVPTLGGEEPTTHLHRRTAAVAPLTLNAPIQPPLCANSLRRRAADR